MKRSGPPKRKAALRADPEKVRAWRARSLLRPPRKSGRETPSPRPLNALELTELRRVRFRAAVPARKQRCERCGARAGSHHHWTPQQALRAHVRGLRLPDAEAAALLRDLLNDPGNLSAFCARCHQRGESWADRWGAADVPERARRFAADLGEWAVQRLERAYPPAPAPGIRRDDQEGDGHGPHQR